MNRFFFFASSYLLLLCLATSARAQTTLWSDDFNNGCASDCPATTWNGWTMLDNDGGTTGSAPNNWFVSCAEEGIVPPGCGSTCVGDASLHIGYDPGGGGDQGAGFNETGAVNATFRTIVSPTINTTGYSTNTLVFDFIAFGSSACSDDRAQLRLSTDNGATWPVGFQYCLNSVCCGACNGYSTGQWTTYTLALPAAFDNNPNVRVGFNWRNNGNGSGTDPSVAIDDIKITTPTLPLNLLEFAALNDGGEVKLTWQTAQETNVSHFELEKSETGNTFAKIGKVLAKGNGLSGTNQYLYYDTHLGSAIAYYRLKMVDQDGVTAYSSIVSVATAPAHGIKLAMNNLVQEKDMLQYTLSSSSSLTATVEIMNSEGKLVLNPKGISLHSGENALSLNIGSLSAGMYLMKVVTPGAVITRKFVRLK